MAPPATFPEWGRGARRRAAEQQEKDLGAQGDAMQACLMQLRAQVDVAEAGAYSSAVAAVHQAPPPPTLRAHAYLAACASLKSGPGPLRTPSSDTAAPHGSVCVHALGSSEPGRFCKGGDPTDPPRASCAGMCTVWIAVGDHYLK